MYFPGIRLVGLLYVVMFQIYTNLLFFEKGLDVHVCGMANGYLGKLHQKGMLDLRLEEYFHLVSI